MNNHLVRYDNPILVSESSSKKKSKGLTRTLSAGKKNQLLTSGRKASLPPVETKTQLTPSEDVLNSILPPKQWEDENAQLWCQYVSSTPATRLDVINLQEQLDQYLLQRKAKDTGICPVREELYSQCFDELIRQVTVNCAERGLLLVRVRDEIRMTIQAYKTLYESSVAFGMRKALLAEEGKTEMVQRIRQLEREKDMLEKQVKEWSTKYEAVEKHHNERRKAEEKKFEDEITFLRKQNQQYKQELDRLMNLPKK